MPSYECVWTIVVGGGSGRRFGGAKQYEALGDVRVIDRAAGVARAASDGVVLVVPADDAEREGAVAGGASRTESVRNGLAAVPSSATVICVHDAARPFASEELFRSVVAAVTAGADAAVPGVPVSDTVKVCGAPVADLAAGVGIRPVIETPRRDDLVAVQTPQAFRADVLRAAHAAVGDAGAAADATDDATLVERAGGHVVVVPGEVDNRKITVAADLDWARAAIGGTA